MEFDLYLEKQITATIQVIRAIRYNFFVMASFRAQREICKIVALNEQIPIPNFRDRYDGL
jgi:hypothetical protein